MKPVKHASYFLTNIREQMRVLVERSFKITFVWVPSHCSIYGNEKADSLAKVGAQEGEVYDRQFSSNEFFPLVRQRTLQSWQRNWTHNELGRWLFSIVPKVSGRAWFRGEDLSRGFIRVMSRLMSNHYSLNAHLYRINLVDSNLCRCGAGYDDIDHVVWFCSENDASRERLLDTLVARDLRYSGHPEDAPSRTNPRARRHATSSLTPNARMSSQNSLIPNPKPRPSFNIVN
ncbi:uncharacterized protein LOC134225599 [Armigeres subalbatus]|uniref:uncharacterized protein LOC134225599 n=1 Tax=Armigeres subalbatus TaxID=124917 RepID=UPI002ED0581D